MTLRSRVRGKSRRTVRRRLAEGEPDADEAERCEQNAEDKEQIMGGLARQSVWQRDAA